MSDTIFALASGGGRAAIAVMRLSGARSGTILDRLGGKRPPARRLALRSLRHPSDGELLDRAMVVWFDNSSSYTGEEAAELHLHGGLAVRGAIAEALVSLGARPADPGEFSQRAFVNGRLDLTAAEGIADLIEAETAEQRRQALRQLDGALSRLVQDWSGRLLRLLAFQEALIDFPDENLPPETEAQLRASLSKLIDELQANVSHGPRGERLREGLVFAIIGAPNVGKSSLINALASRDVAIVSPRPGTTRDVLEARVDLGGVLVTLLDTAGLRDSDDPIEQEGVRRARARAESADLVVAVTDGPPDPSDGCKPNTIEVWNKIDLAVSSEHHPAGVSALTGFGVDRLQQRLAAAARRLVDAGGPPTFNRARHQHALNEALTCLRQAAAAEQPELRGEDLRMARRAIGQITGHSSVENVLDQVFRTFCIGK